VTGMFDLSDAPVLPGLNTTSGFVTATEEQAVIAAIDCGGAGAVPFPWLDRQAADRLLGVVR
jgi:hypothetical protein